LRRDRAFVATAMWTDVDRLLSSLIYSAGYRLDTGCDVVMLLLF